MWSTSSTSKIKPENTQSRTSISYMKANYHFIYHLFRVFGFQIFPTSGYNIVILALAWISLAIVLSSEIYQAILWFLSKQEKRMTKNEICCFVQMLALHLTIAIQYFYVTITIKRIYSKMNTFLGIVVLEVIPNMAEKTTFWKKTKRLNLAMFFTIFFIILITLAACLYTFETAAQAANSQLFTRVFEIAYCFWSIFVVGCCAFYNLTPVFMAIHLDYLIDGYLIAHRTINLADQQHRHQTVTQLLQIIDDIFSNFLIGSLAFELTLIVTYAKVNVESINILQITNGILNIFYIFFFVFKNLHCSNLNDKVQTCLDAHQNLNYGQRYPSMEIHYILYLDQSANDKKEITYGGMFPVRKAFILSVVGTALSYAMILNEL